MSDVVPVRSDRCGLDELFLSYEPGAAERARLALGPGWTRQWTATWQVPGGDEVSLVRDLGPVPVAGREPVRRGQLSMPGGQLKNSVTIARYRQV